MISRNLLPGRLFETVRVTNFMKSLGPNGLDIIGRGVVDDDRGGGGIRDSCILLLLCRRRCCYPRCFAIVVIGGDHGPLPVPHTDRIDT